MKLQLRAFLYAFFRRFVEFFLFNFVVSVMISLLAMRVPGLFERQFLVNFIFCFAGVCLMYAYLIISSWHLWASVEGAWRYYIINGVAYLLYAGIGYGFYFFLPAGASEFFLPYAFFEYLSTRFARSRSCMRSSSGPSASCRSSSTLSRSTTVRCRISIFDF